ncbi:MAG: magnesium transporter CorA family protein [Actinobacteria bacterium]|jgi:magnesium transporter|nr:magnesium transporter CorA family protein [Actinomycetota bacterium]
MLAILKTTPTGLTRLEEFEPGSWIDLVSPSEEELERVSRELQIPLDLLMGPLDEEEKSRIDVEDGLTHLIVDIPVLVREDEQRGYETIPLGMLVHPDYFVTTCLRPNPILGEFERGTVKGFATFWKTRFLLQVLQRVSAFYLRYLGRIDRETDKVERELRASMKNEEIFDLLSLQKSLVYFTTSLRSNEAVLQKLPRTKTIKMYEEDQDLLEDVIIENKQASEMAKIYTDILTGTMNAFASVISNNLNRVMKLLTSLTIILAIPTIVASLYGMNVRLPFEDYSHAFALTLVITVVISAGFALVFWRKRFF